MPCTLFSEKNLKSNVDVLQYYYYRIMFQYLWRRFHEEQNNSNNLCHFETPSYRMFTPWLLQQDNWESSDIK